MNERLLGDDELGAVSGGTGPEDFPWVADSYAWRYGCSDCPHRNIYSARGMCTEVYYELLTKFSNNQPLGERCARREK